MKHTLIGFAFASLLMFPACAPHNEGKAYHLSDGRWALYKEGIWYYAMTQGATDYYSSDETRFPGDTVWLRSSVVPSKSDLSVATEEDVSIQSSGSSDSIEPNTVTEDISPPASSQLGSSNESTGPAENQSAPNASSSESTGPADSGSSSPPTSSDTSAGSSSDSSGPDTSSSTTSSDAGSGSSSDSSGPDH